MEDTNVKVRRIELPPYLPSFPNLSREEYLKLVGKKLIFIRHAESLYQTSDATFGEKVVDVTLKDSKLSARGRLQACQLGTAIEREVGVNSLDLVVCSSLSRSMQTAALAFGSRSNRVICINHCFSEKVDSWSDVERDVDECIEEHVELRGFLWHKTRSRRCVLPDGSPMQRRWGLDNGYPFERESTAMDRVKRCWQWLSDRKEGTIAVVTHSKLLGRENACYGLLYFDPSVAMKMFDNVEMIIVTFRWAEPVFALPSPPDPTPSRHAIVVLGQALNADRSASEVLKDRIHAAVENFNTHKQLAVDTGAVLLPRVIVSGGDAARVGVSEAAVMKRLLIDAGVPEYLVIEEDQSNNSCQNAWYVGSMICKLGITGISLVTSEFHMPRSLYVFEAVFKHLGLFHVEIAPISATSACAMDPIRLTKIYTDHIRACMQWEKNTIISRLDLIFLDKHIPNIRIAPLGKPRLEKAVSDIETLILLHENKYGM